LLLSHINIVFTPYGAAMPLDAAAAISYTTLRYGRAAGMTPLLAMLIRCHRPAPRQSYAPCDTPRLADYHCRHSHCHYDAIYLVSIIAAGSLTLMLTF